MKNKLKLLYLVVYAVIFTLMIACAPPGGVKPVESVHMGFDKREWRIGYSHEQGGQTIMELVLPDESVHSWTELVTIQTFLDAQTKMNVKQLVTNIKATTLKGCPTAYWNIIQENEDEVVYEWQTTGCPNWDNQYEVAKAIKGSAALYVVRYTNKKLPISEDKKNEWINLIRDARARKRASEAIH